MALNSPTSQLWRKIYASTNHISFEPEISRPADETLLMRESPSVISELARELIAARTQAGLTQGEVAARMGTTQSVVARIESGRGTPSMRTVQRFTSAVGARAVVRMEPLAPA